MAKLARTLSLVTCLLFLCSSIPALSYPNDEGQHSSRPSIGLVLGGGGAKGAAHVGVLAYLEQHRIPVDYIVGTSAGSAVAAFYAMGQSAEQIKQSFATTEWEKGYIDSTPRPDLSIRRKQDQRQFAIDFDFGYGNGRFRIPKGVVQGQRLQILLNEMTLAAATITHFDQLTLPYRAVATNLETGNEVILSQGNLAQAIRASMAVPGVFSPVEIDGRMLIDGGLANNLPISVARELGADIIIAVDLATPLKKSEEIDSALGVLEQLSDFMTGTNTATQLKTLTDKDIYIKPQFGDIGSASFDRVDDSIELGFDTAKHHHLALRVLSLSQEDYEHYQEQKQLRIKALNPLAKTKIQRVELKNHSQLNDRMISARIRQEANQPFEPVRLEEDLGKIYGLGYFESIGYLLQKENDETKLLIDAKQKSWGPHFIRFGIEMEDNFKGASEYGLSASVLTMGLNRFGAEWVNTVDLGSSPSFFSEFYQPLNYDGDIFARAFVDFDRFEAAVFQNGQPTSSYEVRQHQSGLEIGQQIDTYADIAIGALNGGGKADVLVGDPNLPTIRFDSGAYYFRSFYDRLDDQFFPSDGHYFQIRYLMNRSELGADNNNDRLNIEALYATNLEDWRLNLGYRSSFLTKSVGSIEDNFRLGGLFNLSGYAADELSGEEGSLYSLRLFKRMSEGFEWYLGGTAEAGNINQRNESLSFDDLEIAGNLFVAANTFLGPVILAFGYANPDKQAIYLSIGDTF